MSRTISCVDSNNNDLCAAQLKFLLGDIGSCSSGCDWLLRVKFITMVAPSKSDLKGDLTKARILSENPSCRFCLKACMLKRWSVHCRLTRTQHSPIACRMYSCCLLPNHFEWSDLRNICCNALSCISFACNRLSYAAVHSPSLWK